MLFLHHFSSLFRYSYRNTYLEEEVLLMKRIAGLIGIILLVICGVFGILYLKTGAKKGVYYEPLEERIVAAPYDSMACYAYSALYHRGKIYVSGNRIEGFDNTMEGFTGMIDKLQLEELSEVYTYDGLNWSTDKTKLFKPLKEKENSAKRDTKIYRRKGYSENRIYRCGKVELPLVSDEEERINYFIETYTCLNGITLTYGKELFEDILHLEEMEKVYTCRWGEGYYLEKDSAPKKQINPKEKLFSSFFSALYEGEFIAEEDVAEFAKEGVEEYMYQNMNNTFIIKGPYGEEAEIHIFPEGYAMFVSVENRKFIVQIDQQLCSQIVKKYF